MGVKELLEDVVKGEGFTVGPGKQPLHNLAYSACMEENCRKVYFIIGPFGITNKIDVLGFLSENKKISKRIPFTHGYCSGACTKKISYENLRYNP